MNLADFGQAIAKIGLPLLGAILPIPGGAAIGSALAAAIGSSSSKPEDILAALTSSADAMEKAKEFQITHTETMLQLHQSFIKDMYAQEVTDRSSARAMQISTRSYTLPVLAWLFVTGFAVITGLKLTGYVTTVDATSADLVTTLRDGLMLILSFYFGSSAGSQNKDILLANSSPNVGQTPSK
ncbi:hypothetical protein AAKU67_002198 [Oxalobacteraceae bacterium GrIS 2.11]